MVRQQQRLSALQVTKLTKPGLYGDGGGLKLQITTTSAKSWLFRYMVAGKPCGIGLGPVHTANLAEAPQKALEVWKLLINGINPLAGKKQNQIAAALDSAKIAVSRRMSGEANRSGWIPTAQASLFTVSAAIPVCGWLR